MLDLNDLIIFQTVANEKSISKAAQKLGYAQSNISMRIKVLESELDTKLLDRTSRGSDLTPHGLKLLEYANQINSLVNNLYKEIQDDNRPEKLTIGGPQTLLAGLIPQMIKIFKLSCPNVDIELITLSASQMQDSESINGLDIAFLYKVSPHLFHVERHLKVNAFLISPLSIDSKSLRSLPLILNADSHCPYRQLALKWQKSQPYEIPKPYYFDSLESIMTSVKQGIGISVVPESLLKDYPQIQRHSLSEYSTDTSRIDSHQTSLSSSILVDLCIHKHTKNKNLSLQFVNAIDHISWSPATSLALL